MASIKRLLLSAIRLHRSRRTFVAIIRSIPVLAVTIALLFGPQAKIAAQIGETETQQEPDPPATSGITQGPFVGHVTPTTAKVWARCKNLGLHLCTLEDSKTGNRVVARVTVTEEHDRCAVWDFQGLDPSHTYSYTIEYDGKALIDKESCRLETAPNENEPSKVKIAFGSCAKEDAGTARVWTRVGELQPDTFVLLGDTPYIDSTDIAVQRKRYREFAAVAEMAQLFRSTSMVSTWDDHDFGRNDTDGQLPGKENSRRAFIEYRANPSYGNGHEGIYTSFRRGGVEVFLLDTRYFAGTEASASDKSRPTLLGADQWQWLTKALKDSTAPFKILASGMIWNGSVRPGKTDHWMNYPHERKALFRFLGEQNIKGVVLVGGDIHRSRVLRHNTSETVGYDLTELITSPMHDGIIERANAPHPGLVFDAGEPHAFLLLTADTHCNPNLLICQLHNASGDILHEVRIEAVE